MISIARHWEGSVSSELLMCCHYQLASDIGCVFVLTPLSSISNVSQRDTMRTNSIIKEWEEGFESYSYIPFIERNITLIEDKIK